MREESNTELTADDYVLSPLALAVARVCAGRHDGALDSTAFVSLVDDAVREARTQEVGIQALEIAKLRAVHEAELLALKRPKGRVVSTPLTAEQRDRIDELLVTHKTLPSGRYPNGVAARVAREVGCSKSQVQSVIYGKV